MKKVLAIAMLACSLPVVASPIVDGVLSPGEYGAVKSTVAYNPAAPIANFGAPTNENASVAYGIYLTADATNYYGLLQANPGSGGSASGLGFANLYFDLNPLAANGSDLGFEITNQRAFIPGVPGYSATPGVNFALSGDGNTLEFSIPLSLLTAPIAGLSYASGQTFPSAGDPVVLRLSQSFGYSVAGGATYGDDRLGAVLIPAQVPEPATLALLPLALAGLRLGRRKQ